MTSGQSILTKAASLPHMDGLMVFNRWRHCADHIIYVFLGSLEFQSETVSRSVQPFLYNSRQSFPILYNGPRAPSQNCSFPRGDLGIHLTHDSLGPSEQRPQMASRSVLSFLQGSLLRPTDRPTDRPRYSVCNNMPHLRT